MTTISQIQDAIETTSEPTYEELKLQRDQYRNAVVYLSLAAEQDEFREILSMTETMAMDRISKVAEQARMVG